MIQKLSIRNFKSIRELDLDCRRVNVFIGEPNAGKTNILEAMALTCAEALQNTKAVCRVSKTSDLFWDQNPENQISLEMDDFGFRTIKRDGAYVFTVIQGKKSGLEGRWNEEVNGNVRNTQSKCRYYLFSDLQNNWDDAGHSLSPPFGSNIARLLYSDKIARQSAGKFFTGSGLKLTVDYSARKLTLVKEEDDVLVTFPYSSASETLRRMIFYHLALETNRDQVLVFDEPEAHAFPPFTKTLAERIALDDRGNQFFLTTHSPYMLDSLLSKTPASDLNVVLCRMENFETKAYPLNQEQIDQIKEWSMDAFFNFDRLLPEVK